MNWKEHFTNRTLNAEEAVAHVKSNSRVFLNGNAGMPGLLTDALRQRAPELHDVELNHLLIFAEDPFRDFPGIRHNAWFLGPGVREAVQAGRADYAPIFLSRIASLVRSGEHDIDTALINVSPPDQYGFMSFGAEVSISKTCAEAAKTVIAQVNHRMPRTLGDSFIHCTDVDYFVEGDEELTEIQSSPPGPIEMEIGRNIASLIEDGATLQMGIGSIPNAVLACLNDKRNLGVHTEMFSDGILPLLESGAVNNQAKGFHRGKIITSFAMGSRSLYEYLDNNPLFEFHPSHYVNDPYIIARNRNMVAVNSAIEVDLTGQVCADCIGERIYSGIGGQVDFIRGAAASPGGKPVIALPSTARKGTLSRIKARLTAGAGVVTSRGDVHYVVTEYGIANMFGKNLRERARALIDIAHPDFRVELRRDCGLALD